MRPYKSQRIAKAANPGLRLTSCRGQTELLATAAFTADNIEALWDSLKAFGVLSPCEVTLQGHGEDQDGFASALRTLRRCVHKETPIVVRVNSQTTYQRLASIVYNLSNATLEIAR